MYKRILLLSIISILIISCGSNRPDKFSSGEERLEYAMKKFNKGDYLDAKKEFRIIVLNNPGSKIVDKAQYYLAECHFKMKEYILASAEFEKLVRMLPNSQYVDDAQYKIGLCNYNLSPKYSLDQSYTKKTIEELQKFTEDYPDSDLKDEAIELMKKCRYKLARKEFRNAELYRRMRLYQAAAIYYESVVNTYYDTKFAEDAQYYMAESLFLDEQYDSAIAEFNKYLEKYPDSHRKDNALKKVEEATKLKADTLSAKTE